MDTLTARHEAALLEVKKRGPASRSTVDLAEAAAGVTRTVLAEGMNSERVREAVQKVLLDLHLQDCDHACSYDGKWETGQVLDAIRATLVP